MGVVVLSDPPSVPSAKEREKRAGSSGACVVKLRDASKRFGDKLAVDALNLEIPAGSCFGLLGSNGAGKTTALRMIYGVTQPTSGSVHVFGSNVKHDPRGIRARLGVTLQDNVLIEPLNTEENLRVFGRYHLLDESRLSRRIEHCLDLLELRSHARLPVANLSGGFRRRVAIAMSLINDPELLILDEPTTGLDPALRMALWRLVRELQAQGKTVLITTHYMEEAQRLCDRVAIMSGGRKICDDSPTQLIESRLAREVVEIDCPPDREPALLGDYPGPVKQLRSGGRLLVYVEDARPLLQWIRQREDQGEQSLVVRPSNLEDVFLDATGTSLEADP